MSSSLITTKDIEVVVITKISNPTSLLGSISSEKNTQQLEYVLVVTKDITGTVIYDNVTMDNSLNNTNDQKSLTTFDQNNQTFLLNLHS